MVVEKREFPDKKAMEKAMELARQSAEAAQYLYQSFKKMVEKYKLFDLKGLVEELKKFAELVDSEHASKGIWDGKKVSTAIENIQQHLANSMSKQLKESVGDKEIRHDIAISDDAELRRGYSTNKESVGKETAKQMDTMFNNWLAKHGFINKKSVIYKFNEESKQYERADASELRSLLNSKEEGFPKYMKEQGFNLNTYQQPYTAKTEEKAAKAEEKAATEMKKELAESKKEKAAPSKETPEPPSRPSASS
ncbi:hypothetical protein [Legionella israelensis]|uniref:Substrate of the Dot/Icm secretion system n=1 Tax=Legionella israelensis TaxID=454 RepID=A0A0W0WJQ7_9GAMM|nr:hypothetical protein [Legionella israelensis]KTD32585.1 substrate of the Dot/Icm secretion system [Legionella israelensis]QBS09870.1 hypothetical protein E4T55_08350 [Legionella israelensis]SCY18111.1 hypothetical protein SAMN02746069_01552 [Legionella israelensis DSM 19235]STX59431.1 Dot/Icm secretion system substrate [Legionella israelensis]